MREELLGLIVCPECRGDLAVAKARWEGGEIVEGRIACRICGKSYPIEEGIVYLVPENRRRYCREEDAAHERALGTGFFDGVKGDIFFNWPHQLPPDADAKNQIELSSHSKSFLRVLERVRGDETVLDFGAGFCWTSRDFAQKGCYVVALDVSPFMLRRAKAYLDHYSIFFERVIADMENMPVRDGSFDLVFGASAIHHACDLRKTASELARAAKSGGWVITIRDHLRPVYLSLEEWKEEDRDSSFGINEKAFNYLEYTEAFWAAGLRPAITLSRHHWSERQFLFRVKQHGHRNILVRRWHALKFWLGRNEVIIDIFAQKTRGTAPWGRPACALLRLLNRPCFRVPFFRFLTSRSMRYTEQEKPFYLASLRAPGSTVGREVVYELEIVSNNVDPCLAKLSLDIYPFSRGCHPDRHVGYWVKALPLMPGERKRVSVRFNARDMRAQFRLGSQWCEPDDAWLGDFPIDGRLCNVGFSLYDESHNQVHGHTLAQRILA